MKQRTFFLLVFAAGFLLAARESAAQDTPRFGIVMGYPAQVGVLWTIGDRIGIRPELNWTHSTTETTTISTIFNVAGVTTNSVTATSTSNAIGPGVTALIYLSTHEGLRTYLAPRFAYSHTSASAEVSVSRPIGGSLPETTTDSYNVSGSFGAQYNAAKHFGVFGEIGVAFGRNTITPGISIAGGELKNRTVGLRSGAGVILFLGS